MLFMPNPVILTVIGARPQFVKAAMVSSALKKANLTEILVHTGQHYDRTMSEIFFEELGLPLPHHNLRLGGGTQGAMTGRMLDALEGLMLQYQPDWVLVYGDTNSTLAAGLAAAKLHIPVAHVEAGMRSFNKAMPEEINRVLVDHLSTLLLVPSEKPVRLLEKEGLTTGVHIVGDIMMDATLQFRDHCNITPLLQRFQLRENQYGFLTLHRAENTNDPALLQRWLTALASVSEHYPLVFPMHPRTRKVIDEHGLKLDTRCIHVCEPMSYSETLALLRHAALLCTDSGGMQKEAYYLETPCLTLRKETEWVETLEQGWNQLVLSPEQLLSTLNSFISQHREPPLPVYGNGKTAEKIVALIMSAQPE